MPTSKIINSIIKASEVLRLLSDGTNRISDLSNRLNLGKGTTHRMLKTLEVPGLVMRDPVTRRYYLGPMILDLASRPLIAHQNLTLSAFEDMKDLRDMSRETVVLHIRMGAERICLEELQCLENIKYTAGKGFVAPIYTGSAGKVLMSELQENELELLLKNIQLEAIGPNTITDKKKLLRELDRVRKQGYATSFGERIRGSASISVPVKNYVCPVVLSVLGPDNRFTFEAMMKILDVMKNRAMRISKKLDQNSQGGK